MNRVQRLVALIAILAALVTATIGLPGNAMAQVEDICPTPTDPPVLDADDDGGVADLSEDTLDFTSDLGDDAIDDVPPPDDTADLTSDLSDDDTNDDLADGVDNTADLTSDLADGDTNDDLADGVDNTGDLTNGSTTNDTMAFAAFQIEECNPCDFSVTPTATSTPTEVPPTATATDPIPQFADFTQSGGFAQIVDCDEYEDGGSDDTGSDDTGSDDSGATDSVTELPKTGNGTNDAGASSTSVVAGIMLAMVFLAAAIVDRRRRNA